jgi:hypothetical protein
VCTYLCISYYNVKSTGQAGWAPVAHVCNPSYVGDRSGGTRFKARQIVYETLFQKYSTQKRASRVAKVAVLLGSVRP